MLEFDKEHDRTSLLICVSFRHFLFCQRFDFRLDFFFFSVYVVHYEAKKKKKRFNHPYSYPTISTYSNMYERKKKKRFNFVASLIFIYISFDYLAIA